MKVAVRYMAQLRHAAGVAGEEVELEGPCRAHELVARLARGHGAPLRELLLDGQGRVQPTILVFVGDEQVRAGQDVTLRAGDVVTLLSPVAGGSA